MDWLEANKNKIEKARNTNIVEYLRVRHGLEMKKEGCKYWRSRKNKKMVFKNNMYYLNNSTGEYGNTIDYLIRQLGYDFKKAVEDICSFDGTITEIAFDEFNINNLELTTDIRRSIAYLNKTRGIGMEFINFIKNMGLLAQTKEKNNVAFLIKDEDFNTVGAELNTTLSDRRFKGLAPNSKYGYGFNISNTNKPKSVLYFESTIDLLSFCQYIGYSNFLRKINTCKFVSMGGLKENIIRCNQAIYDSKIFLCIDNPKFEEFLEDGKKPTEKFMEELERKKYNFEILTPPSKDWNDLIRP
jgi:hypothetical protein